MLTTLSGVVFCCRGLFDKVLLVCLDIDMKQIPNHRMVQMRLSPEELRLFKTALADLNMTATQYLIHSLEIHHKNKETNV